MKFNITDMDIGLWTAWTQVVGLWTIGFSILTVLIHIVFADSGLPRRNPVRSHTRLDYRRSWNMVYSNPPWWRDYSGYLLGNASLAPKS